MDVQTNIETHFIRSTRRSRPKITYSTQTHATLLFKSGFLYGVTSSWAVYPHPKQHVGWMKQVLCSLDDLPAAEPTVSKHWQQQNYPKQMIKWLFLQKSTYTPHTKALIITHLFSFVKKWSRSQQKLNGGTLDEHWISKHGSWQLTATLHYRHGMSDAHEVLPV